MTPLTPYLLVAWLGVGWVAFRRLPGPTAVLAVVVLGQLFLPEIRGQGADQGVPQPLHLPGLKLTKAAAVALAALLGSLWWDRRRWAVVTPRWFDLPMAAWCVCPLFPPVVHGI